MPSLVAAIVLALGLNPLAGVPHARRTESFSDLGEATASAIEQVSAKPKPLMRDFIGLNVHTVSFKPDLYRPVTRLVRDYHPVEWDLGATPANPATFPMSRNGVDWSQLYDGWLKDGYHIDLCAQIETYPPEKWTGAPGAAREYGEALAGFFGPSSANKLVESVEIGNEPGKYSEDQYRNVFTSMAAGVRKGDSKLLIATCAMAIGTKDEWSKDVSGLRGLENLYDIINLHTYAFKEGWPTWRRSYPEDPGIDYLQRSQAIIDWRNRNAPGKQVWLTEFGWDASTKPPPSTGEGSKWVGQTDTEQAEYIVRSYLVFSAMDLDRAYLYYFNDNDAPSLHAASGLTRKYQPKPSFYAVAHLLKTLGDFRFDRALRQTSKVYAYQYAHENQRGDLVWVIWSPTGSGRNVDVELPAPVGKITRAERMPLTSSPAQEVPWKLANDGSIQVSVGEAPVYLWVKRR